MDPKNLSSKPTEPGSSSVLLSLHIAEYEALTTRCTYFMAMQVGLWPVLVLLLPFLLQAHGVIADRALLWLGLLGVQIVLLIYLHLLYEQYLMLLYVEKDLREKVATEIQKSPDTTVAEALANSKRTLFWGYEAFLKEQRGSRTDLSAHRLLAYCLIALLALVVLLERPFTSRDLLQDAAYILANATTIILVWRKAISLSSLRDQIASAQLS